MKLKFGSLSSSVSEDLDFIPENWQYVDFHSVRDQLYCPDCVAKLKQEEQKA